MSRLKYLSFIFILFSACQSNNGEIIKPLEEAFGLDPSDELFQTIATMDSLGGEVEKLRQERERLTQEVQALESRDAKLRRDYGVLENKARKLVQRLKQLKNNVR